MKARRRKSKHEKYCQEFELRDPGHPLGADYYIDENGCWIWLWGCSAGYPVIRDMGKSDSVMRILLDYPESETFYCEHSRKCINIEHAR